MRRSVAIACIPALIALSGCERAPEARAIQPPVVEAEALRFPAESPQLASLHSEPADEEHTEVLRLPGRVVWDETRTVRVFAPLAGRIIRLAAQPGDFVKAGAPLALLSSPDLGQAQAEARKAMTDLELAQKSAARASELHTHGVIAMKELQSAQAEADRAEAERSRALMRLKLYGASERVDQQFTLASPVAGVVVERNANPGQEVRPDQAQPGSPPLFVVTDPTQLWVQIDAPESAIGVLKRGVKLRLSAAPLGDRSFEAHIDQVSDFLDPQTRTARVRANVGNRERLLKAEMYVTADIEVELGKFVRVPATAVYLNGDTQYVFVDEGSGRYRRKAVKADEAGFGTMRVRSGLAKGERVVTQGGLLLMQVLGAAKKFGTNKRPGDGEMSRAAEK